MPVAVPNISILATQSYGIPQWNVQANLGTRLKISAPLSTTQFTAILVATNKIILGVGGVPASVNTSPSNYTVTGSTSITVTGVTYSPGDNFITLTTTGTYTFGSYQVTLAFHTYDDGLGNFNSTAPEPLIQEVSGPTPLTFTAACTSLIVTLTFDRDIVDSIPLRNIANYTITPLGGQPTPNILSVTTTHNTAQLLLDDCLNGGSYQVALAAATAVASNDGGTNVLTPQTFTGAGAPRPAIAASFATSPTTLRIVFTKAVRQVSSSNTDDALHLANYSVIDDKTLATLPISAVTGRTPTTVDITTSTQVAQRQYTVNDANIKDLAGNVVI